MNPNKNNLALYLPFDEPAGSLIAYDYSPNRADGAVIGADFVGGKIGNAIEFRGGSGYCEVQPMVVNIAYDFSIVGWVNPLKMQVGSPTKAIWVMNFVGLNNYVDTPIELNTGNWVSLGVTKEGSLYTFYINGSKIKQVTRSELLVGLSLNQDCYNGDYGQSLVDDFKVFDVALTEQEMQSQISETKSLEYYIDGVNLKDYGVYVSASDGLLDRPKMKAPTTFSWDNYHGQSVDLYHKFYESRDITLSCFIKAENKTDFTTIWNSFVQLFNKKGTHRLIVEVHPTKPLVYEVYSQDSISLRKTWGNGNMVGTFALSLKEPAPVKRILKHFRINAQTSDCSITITTKKLVDIYWGDGEVDYDVFGTGKVITHTYNENGEYYIIVAGDIDEIELFETNAIIVWSKLQ